MEAYQDLVRETLLQGRYRPNRTAVDTISTFSQHYSVDLSDGFPLLTTKKMDGFRWNSLIHELLWYFSGQEHVRELSEKTGIWDAWADDDGSLPTAYGRFWRRYPLPGSDARLPGEWWPIGDSEGMEAAASHYGVDSEAIDAALDRWVEEESDGRKVFDQIQYLIDTLNGDHPYRGPESRRLVVNAWHPANAAVSKLPPCHFTFVFNVQGDKLNLHLTQRSGDIALGVPFNIAAYALIARIIAQRTGFKLGSFSHTIVDAHIYCGRDDRGRFYSEHLDELQERLSRVERREGFLDVRDWIEENAPAEEEDGFDHVPGLLEQLSRTPRQRPAIAVADKPIDDLVFDDIELEGYNPHDGIRFRVAE